MKRSSVFWSAAILSLSVALVPVAAQTVTSVQPPVLGQSIARALARINLAGAPNSGKTISDGLAFTVDGTAYGRGTWTYEFNFSGGLNIPGAIEVTPSSNDVIVSFLKLAEDINANPNVPFWAQYYFPAPGDDFGIGNGWFMLVWKYDNEWRLTPSGGLNIAEAADPGGDMSIANFSTNNNDVFPVFLWLEGTGLDSLNNTTSVKLRHDVNTNEVYNATLTAKYYNTATAKIPLSTGIGSPPVFPSLGDYDLEVNGVIVLDKAVTLVQNLLDDQSFRLHSSGGAAIWAAHNSWDYMLSPYWRRTMPYPTTDGLRKGSVWRQFAPRVYPFQTDDAIDSNSTDGAGLAGGDNEYGSLQWSTTGDGVHRLWQSAYVNFAQPTTLTLTGVLAAGAEQRDMTYGIQLRSGDENGTIVAETPPGQRLVNAFDWLDFSLSGAFPAGTTQVTVVFYGEHPEIGPKALHIDSVLLRVDSDHPTPPRVTGMTTPAYAAAGSSDVSITLTGANLTAGQTSVRLEENIVSFGTANWGDVGKFLSMPGEQYEKGRSFATYEWRDGDVAVLTGGTGVVPGEYTVVRRVDDGTIELASDINGAAIDINNRTVTGWIRHPAIEATSVSASGSQLTATFDLTDVPAGSRNIVVQVGDKPPVVWRDGFQVAQPGPSLVNGSFELPEAPQDCNNRTETFIPANDWVRRYWSGYLDIPSGATPNLWYRDDRWIAGGYDLPSCPPADRGLHYASTNAYSSKGTAQYSQTVTADAGKIYTLSGFFGHTDLNKISLSLLDGDSAAPAMTGATTEVLPAGSFQDWTFAYVTGTATGGLMTAAWEVENVGSTGPRAAWTDHLVLEECTQPVTVTSVSPPAIANDVFGPVTLTITGSGFSGTPVIHFVATGHGLEVDNVVVVNDTTITCEVNNWPTPATVAFDVIVRSNGCIGELSEGFVTASTALLNPEFEDPAANLNCDPRTPNTDRIDFWNFSDQLIREGDVHAPAECPLLSCSCPTQMEGCAGGHYASMSTGEGEDEIAWQTLKVIPGSGSNFGGFFSWGGSGTVNIKLVDGYGPDGTVLASTSVPQGNEWCFASVEGFAQGHLVTVVWELVGTTPGVPSAVHADSMRFAASPCHDPFADVDSDGDVDQEDFAVLQRCYTGPNLGPVADEPVQCACLDVEGSGGMPDNDIDAGDLAKFQLCASGPFILADPACDD